MQLHSLALADCLRALQEVYQTEVNQGLLLRALCFFDDADGEPPLPGEGAKDWDCVQHYFSTAVAALLVPPQAPLRIQANVVDLRKPKRNAPKRGSTASPGPMARKKASSRRKTTKRS